MCTPDVTSLQKSVFEVIRRDSAGEPHKIGMATAIDANAYLVTARHLLSQAGEIRGPNGSTFLYDIVVLPDEASAADWALIKLRKSNGDSVRLRDFVQIRYELPEFNLLSKEAKIFVKNGGSISFLDTLSPRAAPPLRPGSFFKKSYYEFCPVAFNLYLQSTGKYSYGDSGSPIVDSCNRLVGITSAFLEEPFSNANEYLDQWIALTSGLQQIATMEGSGITPPSDTIDDVGPLDIANQEMREQKVSEVRKAWLSLVSTFTTANYVAVTPASCFSANIAGRVADGDRSLLSTPGDLAGAALADIRQGNPDSSTVARLEGQRLTPFDITSLIASAIKLDPRDGQNIEFEYAFRRFLNSIAYMPLYKSFVGFKASRYKTFIGYQDDIRDFVSKNYVNSQIIDEFVHNNNETPGYDGSLSQDTARDGDVPNDGAATLIAEGQRLLSSVPPIVRTSADYAITGDERKVLDNSIIALATGTGKLNIPVLSKNARGRRYIAKSFADLALALQKRRQLQSNGLSSVDPEQVTTELKAAKISLMFDASSVVAWDVAAKSFYDQRRVIDAWWLAGIALQARCGKRCRVILNGNADHYASALYSNVIAYKREAEEKYGGLADTDEGRLITELREEQDATIALQTKSAWLSEVARVGQTDATSLCKDCPSIGSKVVEAKADAAGVKLDVIEIDDLADFLVLWPGFFALGSTQ